MPKRQTPKAITAPKREPAPLPDHRDAMERIEDTAFQNRLSRLIEARKWAEVRMAFLMYGSSLSEREPGHHGLATAR